MCQQRYAALDNLPFPLLNAQNQTPQPPPIGLERIFGQLPENGKFWTSEVLSQHYKRDQHSRVLDIVVYTAAYFRVACKRVIDVVPMCIENRFLLMFAKALRDKLEDDMGLLNDNAAEVCARFTVEDPDTNEKRENLTRMKATLLEGLKIIGEVSCVRP